MRADLRICIAAVLLGLAACCGIARAEPYQPSILKDVGIDQKTDAQVPLDLAFKDEVGRDVHLRDYFNGKPVILTLVYYECPMLCTMVLNDLARSMNSMPIDAGKDFDIITVSFNPRETPELAMQKKESYLAAYRRPTAADGWHFLTGSQESITQLTQAVGFRYAWDAAHQLYAHASGIMILTPDGKISRYFFGIDYEPVDLRLSLVEASNRKIATPTDQVLLYCFQYDPRTGKYGLVISRLLRLLGVITVVMVAGFVSISLHRDRQRRLAARAAEEPSLRE